MRGETGWTRVSMIPYTVPQVLRERKPCIRHTLGCGADPPKNDIISTSLASIRLARPNPKKKTHAPTHNSSSSRLTMKHSKRPFFPACTEAIKSTQLIMQARMCTSIMPPKRSTAIRINGRVKRANGPKRTWPMKGMPFRLRALVHSSDERSSTKAYLLLTRQVTTGLPGEVVRLTCSLVLFPGNATRTHAQQKAKPHRDHRQTEEQRAETRGTRGPAGRTR